MNETEYEQAWKEGEEGGNEPGPATEAVKAAKKAGEVTEQDEYIKAYTEMDEAEKKAEEKEDKKGDAK